MAPVPIIVQWDIIIIFQLAFETIAAVLAKPVRVAFLSVPFDTGTIACSVLTEID